MTCMRITRPLCIIVCQHMVISKSSSHIANLNFLVNDPKGFHGPSNTHLDINNPFYDHCRPSLCLDEYLWCYFSADVERFSPYT